MASTLGKLFKTSCIQTNGRRWTTTFSNGWIVIIVNIITKNTLSQKPREVIQSQKRIRETRYREKYDMTVFKPLPRLFTIYWCMLFAWEVQNIFLKFYNNFTGLLLSTKRQKQLWKTKHFIKNELLCPVISHKIQTFSSFLNGLK